MPDHGRRSDVPQAANGGRQRPGETGSRWCRRWRHGEASRQVDDMMTGTSIDRRPSSARLRLGILGAGMIAVVPYGFLPGLRLLSDRVEVAAITSRTRARAEAVARDFGIPA